MRYEDIYANLWNSVEEFTTKEFRDSGISPAPDKVLHDMVRRGFLRKVGRSLYEVKPPKEFLKEKITNYEKEANWLLENAPLEFAFCGSDAVGIWTNGGYYAGGSRFVSPINIAIKERDLGKWKRFLHSIGKPFIIQGKPFRETIVGAVFVLHPRKRLEIGDKDGLPVIPLKETVRMCMENPFVYEPALEMFDKLYGTRTGVRYDTYKA
jgi:hypothetical protein